MKDQRASIGRLTFTLLLFLILVTAGWVRLFQLNWDEGTHLHPDERYLTMVASALRLPESLGEYWDTATSTLNPENQGYGGYVYGTLPLFAARVGGEWLDGACGESPAFFPALVRQFFLDASGPCYPGTYSGYSGIHLVGRLLSISADLFSLIALALLGRLLFGDRVGLLAGALYAFAVLPIQHAHFFVVDSFATVFVVWTLLFAVWALERDRSELLLLAGLTTGLAVASKVSVWPLAAVVGLAGVLQIRAEPMGEAGETRQRYTLALTPERVGLLFGAGLLAFLAFRSAQPYAFTGPGFFNFRISETWFETMRRIRDLMSGDADSPPGHQWTARSPILFPWRNMVFWGLGLPLGLTAWIGWGAAGWQLLRRRKVHWLLPWLWGTGFFLYQGTQWVKSMRYLLPIYPVFVLFAAWLALRIAESGRGSSRRRIGSLLRPLGLAVPWLVLAGAFIWSLAFLNVYARPYTRVTASRWMYRHIPTAVTLHTETGLDYQVPVYPDSSLIPETVPNVTRYTVETSGVIAGLSLNKVQANGFFGVRHFRVELAADEAGLDVLTAAELRTPVDSPEPLHVHFTLEPLAVEADQSFYVRLSLLEGAPVQLGTSVIANEHWDDGLPVRLDGKDPFGGWYRGLSSSPSGQMNLYDNDDAFKRESLLAWLDEADYIVLSSNRLYGSIPRLPKRYPLTTAYYQALFAEELGFRLAAEFVSYPSLGPCQFPDQEQPFPVPTPRYTNALPCDIPYPPAEEAFSVYDHPTVLIFEKTASYSRPRVEAQLPPSLLANVRWMTPRQATRNSASPSLLFTPRERAVQASGGTWSELFNRQALHNRHHWIAAGLWWLLLTALGWLAFPWLTLVFPALRDRGYGLARIAGLLMWVYPGWLLASLQVTRHTRLLLWLLFAAFAVASLTLVWFRREQLRAYLQTHWRELLRIEVIFALLYTTWVLVRVLNPDLYHPVAGGEKPMDFAYLNAVIRSSWFPPYDPWFAGGWMNYYYFGFVLMGAPIKALGILPEVAYNLAIPSLFAMTGVGAYTLASNLAGVEGRRAWRAGLWGVAFAVLLGNLGELVLILEGLAEVGNVQFESFIPGYRLLVSAFAGLWKVIFEGETLRFRPEWWYWNATRVVQPGPGEYVGPINEFPLFTFLYADLHAHAIALPLTQLALGIALQAAQERYVIPGWRRVTELLRGRRPLLLLGLGALVAGALRATNTWDYPTYLALIGLGYLLPLLTQAHAREHDNREEASSPSLLWYLPHLLIPVALLLLAELLFRPFSMNYATTYNAVEPWRGSKTPLGDYIIMHGQFLLPLALFIGAEGVLLARRLHRSYDRPTFIAMLGLIAVGMLALLLVFVLALDVWIALLAVPLGTLAALLLLDTGQHPRKRTLWLWMGTALAITLVVEIVVLKGDIGRMNTVFKPYMQVWTLFSVTAAVTAASLWSALLQSEATSRAEKGWRWLTQRLPAVGDVTLAILTLTLLASALYPLFAIPAKIRDRWVSEAPITLDGMAFLEHATQYENGIALPLEGEARVIRWLQDNVTGSPVIMEKNAEAEYVRWGNRVSIYTGLPTVIGWRWHQAQQRMVMPGGTVEGRQQDVVEFYNTPSSKTAWEILQRYHVEYVVLTPYERAYMQTPLSFSLEGEPDLAQHQAEAEAKFDSLVAEGRLEIVFHDPESDARIYRVVR